MRICEVSSCLKRFCQKQSGQRCWVDFILFNHRLLHSCFWELTALTMPPSTGEIRRLRDAPTVFFFFDWPRFEALQNKNTQLLLVLTDDWISKLIIRQGIYGFLCISVVFSCPLCLSLSLHKARKVFLPLNLLPLCCAFIKGLLKTRGVQRINTSHTFIIKHMFKNFGNIMLQQLLMFLFSGNCIWTKKGRISHCLRFCSPSTRHWRSPEMSLPKWWDILV